MLNQMLCTVYLERVWSCKQRKYCTASVRERLIRAKSELRIRSQTELSKFTQPVWEISPSGDIYLPLSYTVPYET
jgi:hypothetical protein